MPLNATLQYSAAGFCIGLAFFALQRNHRMFVHRMFAVGMTVLALESLLSGLSVQALSPERAIVWQQWRSLATAFLPGIWLLFSLSLARETYRTLLGSWKWTILGVFLLPLVFATALRGYLFIGPPILLPDGWEIALGWSGYALQVCLLLGYIPVITIIE